MSPLELTRAMYRILRTGLQSLDDPAANPVAAVFTLAIVVLGLLILILLAFLAVTLLMRGPNEPEDEHVARPSRNRTAISGLLAAFVVIALVTFGWSYSGSDAMCARCHFTQDARESHATDVHSTVACARCHIGSGIGNGVAARATGIRNVVTQLEGRASVSPVPAPVANSACVGCHRNVLRGTTLARGVRMRHSDLLEVGYACVECHNTEGHGTAVRKPAYPTMSQCIACHDGERAGAECDLCHSRDVGVAVRRRQRAFPQVVVKRDDCRGCHSLKACNDCHGLELPHSTEFKNGFHARKGLQSPSACVKCHDIAVFCNTCHEFKVSGIGASGYTRNHATSTTFVSWHANTPAVGLGSCLCHDEDRERFCNYCHGPQPER